MIQAITRLVRLTTVLICTGFAAAIAAGQPLDSNAVSLPTAGPPLGTDQANPPALPGEKTEADQFRELLNMSPSERAQALADRPNHQRAYLKKSLRTFDSLSPAQREVRLKQLELSCRLERLMRLAPNRRAKELAAVPPDLRPIVEERLRRWDRLPPQVQQEALEYETTANYLLYVRAAAGASPTTSPSLTPPPPVPGEQNSVNVAQPLAQFMQLPSKEQRKTLEALPPAERQQMERTLNQFARLSPEERSICIRSFQKFSNMSKEDRDEFLRNAARWKAMSAGERETWRTLVEILPPAGTNASAPPLP